MTDRKKPSKSITRLVTNTEKIATNKASLNNNIRANALRVVLDQYAPGSDIMNKAYAQAVALYPELGFEHQMSLAERLLNNTSDDGEMTSAAMELLTSGENANVASRLSFVESILRANKRAGLRKEILYNLDEFFGQILRSKEERMELLHVLHDDSNLNQVLVEFIVDEAFAMEPIIDDNEYMASLLTWLLNQSTIANKPRLRVAQALMALLEGKSMNYYEDKKGVTTDKGISWHHLVKPKKNLVKLPKKKGKTSSGQKPKGKKPKK